MLPFWMDFFNGVILSSLCILGVICNLTAIFVLNSNAEMRSHSINLYLSVLEAFDVGVLICAFFVDCFPSILQLMSIPPWKDPRMNYMLIIFLPFFYSGTI